MRVRLIVVLLVLPRFPVRVFHCQHLFDDTCFHQCLIEGADLRIVTHHVTDIAVRLLNHLVYRLHDTILYGVVFQIVVDIGHTLQVDDGIAVVIEAWRCCQIASHQIGRIQTVCDHVEGDVHIRHDVCPGDGVAVRIRQLVQTAESTLLQVGTESIVRRDKTSVVSVRCQQVHQACSFHNFGEITVFRPVLEVVTHHLTGKGVIMVTVRLIGATGQKQ